MRNYLITYSWPEKYRGSYLISAEDGIEASNKLSCFLKENIPRCDTESIFFRSHAGLLKAVDGCGALRQVQADERRDRVHRVDDQTDGVMGYALL